MKEYISVMFPLCVEKVLLFLKLIKHFQNTLEFAGKSIVTKLKHKRGSARTATPQTAQPWTSSAVKWHICINSAIKSQTSDIHFNWIPQVSILLIVLIYFCLSEVLNAGLVVECSISTFAEVKDLNTTTVFVQYWSIVWLTAPVTPKIKVSTRLTCVTNPTF